MTHEETVRRISALCDGAKVDQADRPRLSRVVVERIQHHGDTLHSMAESGDSNYRRLVSDGHATTWELASDQVASSYDIWSRLLNS